MFFNCLLEKCCFFFNVLAVAGTFFNSSTQGELELSQAVSQFLSNNDCQ